MSIPKQKAPYCRLLKACFSSKQVLLLVPTLPNNIRQTNLFSNILLFIEQMEDINCIKSKKKKYIN